MSKNIEKKMSVVVPMVPNFIKVGNDMISVARFTESELREIGQEWTEKLIKHAQRRR